MTFAGPVVEVAEVAMDTVFALQVADPAQAQPVSELQAIARAAFAAVHEVERSCSRFDGASELSQLCQRPGEATAVSPLLLELVALALAFAEASDGAFDPTVGDAVMRLGFDREWRTRQPVAPRREGSAPASWRDVHVDRATGTIRLAQPMLLDLGAIAKGFAVDLMLASLPERCAVSIHAGGDVRCRGPHPDGRAWRVGIRDPLAPDRFVAVAQVDEGAVCTSGRYERVSDHGAHHLVDPKTRRPVSGLASVTVVAPTAVVADGMATAAFVLGPARGADWLAAQGVDALLIDDEAQRTTVAGAGMTTWEWVS